MPSVPSRLAAVFACALALMLAAPALADKKPGGGGNTPPAPLPSLQAPGQSSQPAPSTTPKAQTPTVSTPPSTGGTSGFTQKMDKGKNTGFTSKPKGKDSNGGGSSSSGFTKKQNKGTSSAPSSAPVTSAGATPSPSSTSTPAGGSSTPSTPSTPTTNGGGAQAKPKQTNRRAHRGGSTRRTGRTTPSSGVVTPRTFAPVTRPVSPVGPAPTPAKTTPKPKRNAQNGDALARVRVSVVTRTVHDLVQVLPAAVKAVIGAMAALLLAAIAAWATVTVRARRLRRQRGQLAQEVGLLQTALLPEVPAQIGPLAASVAYRPADGPGAGGDFYDVFQLENGHVGLVLGDVAGHGRDALARTALLRYTLRAYLETGLEPRIAMRLAGETLDHNLSAGFATAAVAVYQPETGKLTFSCAGHPPPILLGAPEHEPVVACSAPPIGVGERTGMRQTTVTLPAGSLACFFTDGLAEARVDGELYGRERLGELIEELGGELTASELIERFRTEVHHMPDDMAACILRPVAGEAVEADGPAERLEELELRDGGERDLRRFLAACGIPAVEIGDLVRSANARAEDYGGAIVRVKLVDGEHPQVSLVLPLVESLATAAA